MKREAGCYHVPVMLSESIEALNVRSGGTYVDVTFGGGGHSRAILEAMGNEGHLFAFDQDADAMENIPQGDPRLTFVWSNFRYLRNWMRYYGIEHIDGLLADLGVSSHHFDDAQRGFSFREDGPLDMRMNRAAGQSAADLINTCDEERLANILYMYGELRQSRPLAAAIVKRRAEKPLRTVGDLLAVAERFMPRGREKKDLAKMFQALRIEVNHEMDALSEMLLSASELLNPGGRLVVLTYHSLEDRMVKNVMRSGNTEGRILQDLYGNTLAPLRMVRRKVDTATNEEQLSNPRSRSAKLRVAERVITENDKP